MIYYIKKLNGVSLYLIGILLLFILNTTGFLGILYILLYFFANPLMIFVYDYIINPQNLIDRLSRYYVMATGCFITDLFIWDYARIIPKKGNEVPILNFFDLTFVITFIIQLFCVIYLRKKRIRSLIAVPILFVFPFFTYGILTFILSIMSQWTCC